MILSLGLWSSSSGIVMFVFLCQLVDRLTPWKIQRQTTQASLFDTIHCIVLYGYGFMCIFGMTSLHSGLKNRKKGVIFGEVAVIILSSSNRPIPIVLIVMDWVFKSRVLEVALSR